MTNQYFKKRTREQFQEKYGKEYLFGDALAFGNERIEIKAVKIGIGAEGWTPTMLIFKAHPAKAGNPEIEWENPTVRDFDPEKDW